MFADNRLRLAIVALRSSTFVVASCGPAVYDARRVADPRWDDSRPSAVVGTCTGIGLGSPLADGSRGGRRTPARALWGRRNDHRCAAAGPFIDDVPLLVGCIVAVGFSPLYIVPLFSSSNTRPQGQQGGHDRDETA